MNRKLAIERARNCNRGCLVTGLRVMHGHRGERTIEKYGGLDKFLLNYKKRKMPMQALTLRKELLAVTNNKNEVIQPESLG